MESIKSAFKDFLAALQMARLYATRHPMFEESLDKAYLSLQEPLKDRDDLTIGIVGEELAFQKEVFFDLSKLVKPAINFLRERKIEKIGFCRGVNKEELRKFIEFLCLPKEEIKGNFPEQLQASGINNIVAGTLQVSGGSTIAKDNLSVDASALYETSLDKISQSTTAMVDNEACDLLFFRLLVNNIIKSLTSQGEELLKLVTVKRFDATTFTHLLNVSILSMYFASKLGYKKDDVLDLGIAALLHDIGKLYISRKLIKKSGSLTDEELAQVKKHTFLGAELLLQYVDSLGILPVVVAFQHHPKYNLKASPDSALSKPHIASSLVSLCDTYDALSCRRSYKADYPPDAIYQLMLREKDSSFYPELTDKFFSVMGVWPIGSIVSLSDGRVAAVVEQNEADCAAPKVKIISPVPSQELLDLSQLAGRIKIERYLNPWKEAKQFLHLV
jgi:putative nucleotidyltransferase with HDIG domain